MLVSPVVEACPTDNKQSDESSAFFLLLGTCGSSASFTLFFRIFGIENWKYMALVWALIPIVNGVLFTRVPIAPLLDEGEEGLSMANFLRKKSSGF